MGMSDLQKATSCLIDGKEHVYRNTDGKGYKCEKCGKPLIRRN